ncbi:MAG TPA: amino acid permease [Acidimicrobiales bacterium]|jgi:amino acid transporter|nr:amino acid permease [Acidimicrobiales bacterium]
MSPDGRTADAPPTGVLGTRPQPTLTKAPGRTFTTKTAQLPETFSYRVKRKLLGPPLVNDQLEGQRLGKPTALAVLSSDVMSSAAYATEEILRILVPVAGLVAFSIVTPITGAILAVLAVVTILYRDVVRSYPKAGGSYVVSRDNFGPNVAQVAGAALLISYTITVAVSVAAGADAIISAFPSLKVSDALPMSIFFVVLLAFGNLRGLREAGKVFALPTYFFIANMAVLIISGFVKKISGTLHHASHGSAHLPLGHASGGLILGITAFYLLKGFANGSSAMTGTEAISNGVSIFRDPQPRNARTTLVLMSTILGTLFIGVSSLAAFTHAVPFVSGTPTVLSEIGKLVYGSGAFGNVLYYMLQTATALILILAANTSFTGFPFLVSFVAEDSFLPRKLTVRGHRLVFSNGILLLAGASILLLVATQAKVAALIPMYAIGVFTGFTMAGAGMFKHHWTHREAHWRLQAAVSGFAAVVCIVVVIVFAATEFLNGAWVVVVVMPALVYALVRTNRQYRTEDTVLEEGAAVAACEARILRRHVVVILIDRIDLAAARAIQYARTLSPDDLRAVHFNIDEARAQNLMERWQRVGLTQLPLDVIDCPDRRLGRAALELAAELADGETEVSMLLPRRSYGKALRRILHDQTADYIVDFVSQLSHVNATIVPFLVAPGIEPFEAALIAAVAPGHTGEKPVAPAPVDLPVFPLPTIDGVTPISALQWRRHAKISGRVKTLRVQPWSGVSTLECVIVDNSGEAITLVFLGRRSIPGIRSGTLLTVESTVGKHHGMLAMINPLYEILSTSEPSDRA